MHLKKKKKSARQKNSLARLSQEKNEMRDNICFGGPHF
jgi:hypothetical protein